MQNEYTAVETLSFPIHSLKPYPDTISASWYYLKEMNSIYPHNNNFIKNIQDLILSHNMVGWKKSRGDGNCYYRSVISYYLLRTCKPYESVQLLKDFSNKIQQLSLIGVREEYLSAISKIQKNLEVLISYKESGHHLKAFEEILKYTQDIEYDNDLVRVARIIAYNELLKWQYDDEYKYFISENLQVYIDQIFQMGNEAEGLVLVLLPKALNVIVVQFMFLEKENYNITNFPQELPGAQMYIYLVRRSGHYDILMTVYEMELDQINFEGSYTFIKDVSLYEGILESVKKYAREII